MTVRSGLTDLVSYFRQLIAESGTAIFTDDSIQNLLDNNRLSINRYPLQYQTYLNSGTTIYANAKIPYAYLEGTASGTALVRVTNNQGSIVTNYQSDFTNGQFTFDNNTLGTVYYYTGRYFNFNKAVSEAWGIKAGYYANNFDFRVEGRQFNKSQIYQHCLDMQKQFSSMAEPIVGTIDNGGSLGVFDNCQRFDVYERYGIISNGEYSHYL